MKTIDKSDLTFILHPVISKAYRRGGRTESFERPDGSLFIKNNTVTRWRIV